MNAASGETLYPSMVFGLATFVHDGPGRGIEKQRLGLDVGMAQIGLGGRFRLTRALSPEKDRLGSFQENIHVEEEGHVLDVVEVKLKFPT
jgi:hypothetical protein